MPKIIDPTALRYLNGPQAAMFNDPYKAHSSRLEDKRFGISAAELKLAQDRDARERDQSNSGSLPSGYRWTDAAHTKQEIIPGGPADTGSDSPTGGLSEQAMVKALSDGRMAFPTGAALRSPYWQNMLAKVAQADPNFDAINYNSRAATRRDFTSGKSAQNITAFNTALGHLGTLNDAVAGLGNRSFTPWNWLANGVEQATGDPSVDKFNASAHAVVDELEKAFRGSNGTQAGIEEWKKSLNSSQSPAQAHAVISQMVDLLGSRINALGEQYKQGMGRSIDGITLLDPHAQAVFSALKLGGTGKIGKEPPNNNPLAGGSGIAPPGNGGGGTGNDGGAAPNQPNLTPGGGDRTFYTNRDQAVTDAAQKAFASGATKEQIQAIGQKYGGYTFGPELDRALEQRAHGSIGAQFTPLPTGHEERGLSGKIADAVGSNYGSFATGVGNALTVGQLGNIAKATGGSDSGTDLAMDLSRRNAMPYMLGEMAGSVLPTMGAARGLGMGAEMVESPFARAILTNPATADAVYGSGYGASTSDDPLKGALIGGALSGAGSFGAAKIGAGIARLRAPSVAEALNAGESAVLKSVNKTGRDAVIDALQKADNLGVPATLADVSPEVNSLTGAAIRRSPTVAGMARDTLIPRGRGQIDRFGQAVERDLGPVANTPQLSADLGKQAATDAAPLYEKAFQGGSVAPLEHQFGAAFADSSAGVAQAQRALADAQNQATQAAAGVSRAGDNVYGASAALRGDGEAQAAIASAQQNLTSAQATHEGNLARLRQAQADGSANAPGAVWSPRIQQFLDDPISKAGLARGLEVQRLESLAAGKPFDPTELAITHMDDAGNPVVAAVPNMRTLDAVKRGFDEILNDYPRQPSGQLILDQRGRAVDQVRKAFLGHLDSINDDYGAARAAYAGPMASRDALDRGGAFANMTPDTVGVAVQGQTPEQLAQMQLGYRSKMMDAAEGYRLSANPFEGVLGTRAAEDRLTTLYGDTPGVAQLLAQRDLEGQMAGSSNRLIGNSFTAGNQIADDAFSTNPLVEGALHAGAAVASHGASLPGTAARLVGPTLRDRITLGLGQSAVVKADQIGPITLNTDPQDTIANLLAMEQQQQDYSVAKALMATTGAQRGGQAGSAVAASLIPYATAN